MKVYTIDNILFTHAKVSDDVVYKLIETMEANKADMVAVAPNLREFSAAGLNKKLRLSLPSRRLEIFQGQEHRSQGDPVTDRARQRSGRGGAAPPSRPRNGMLSSAEELAASASRDHRLPDQSPAGAAGRLRRALGHGRAQAGVQRLVLYRAAADRLPRADAGARLRRGDAARNTARSIRRARSPSPPSSPTSPTASPIRSTFRRCCGPAWRWRSPGPCWRAGRASRAAFDFASAAVSLLLCGYIFVRYEPLTYELAMLPVEGIVGSAILLFLVLEASRRTSGFGFVCDHPGDGGLHLHQPAPAGRLPDPLGLAGAAGRLSRPRRQQHDRRDPAGRGAGGDPVHHSRPGAGAHRRRRFLLRHRDGGHGPLPRRRRQDRGGGLGAVRDDLGQRGVERAGGRHRHHPDHDQVGLLAATRRPRSSRSARPAAS